MFISIINIKTESFGTGEKPVSLLFNTNYIYNVKTYFCRFFQQPSWQIHKNKKIPWLLLKIISDGKKSWKQNNCYYNYWLDNCIE